VAVGEKADVLLKKLIENAPLIIGDDQVANTRKRHRHQLG
jgi:hypothetical protein